MSENEGYGVGYVVALAPSTTVALSYNDAYANNSGNYASLLGDGHRGKN